MVTRTAFNDVADLLAAALETDMEHGTQRNWKEVTEHGEPVEFKDAKTGAVVFKGPMCSRTFTQSERFCRNCGWVTCKGILGAILCPSCSETW